LSVTGQVLTGVTPVTPPLSLRGYARHRDTKNLPGATVQAVLRAIARGRLNKSLIRDGVGKAIGINDADLADSEWAATTDLTKAPAAVAIKAMAAGSSSPPPGDAGSGSDGTTAFDPNVVGSAAAPPRPLGLG
jgi:hypothetical protein